MFSHQMFAINSVNYLQSKETKEKFTAKYVNKSNQTAQYLTSVIIKTNADNIKSMLRIKREYYIVAQFMTHYTV